MSHYPKERKESILKKMMPPNNCSIEQISKEEGISTATLYLWRKQARAAGVLLPAGNSQPDGWNSRDKFAAVIETAAFNEAELAEYCRKRGLYPEQIEQWRQACEQANDWDNEQNKRLKQEQRSDRKKYQALEKELHRKEKALAEAAALLVLRKKLAALWEEHEEE
jgi:hypothetical protein